MKRRLQGKKRCKGARQPDPRGWTLSPGACEQPEAPRAAPGTYELRVLVHRVDGASAFGEFFPDVYVKARMHAPRGAWQRTDVHYKCVDGEALFEYRLVLPRFTLPTPPPPPSRGRARRAKRPPPPTLEVVAMDEDRLSRNDRLGGAKLRLTELVVPEDGHEQCGLATLHNPRVNLFRAASLGPARGPGATFPRELTGYWPLVRKKRLSREPLAACSVRLTLQLLSEDEAAARPADSGNSAAAGNRFPTLARPARRHGRLRDRLLLGRLALLEAALLYSTGMASVRRVVLAAALVALLFSTNPSVVVAAVALVLGKLCHFLRRHPAGAKAGVAAGVVVCGLWGAWTAWRRAAPRSPPPDEAKSTRRPELDAPASGRGGSRLSQAGSRGHVADVSCGIRQSSLRHGGRGEGPLRTMKSQGTCREALSGAWAE